MQIRFLEPEQIHAWDSYVESCESATFFHRSQWKFVVHKAFGHRPYYLFAERDGGIVGVLPLFQVKSLLFGHALVSVPFGVYGGVAADDEPARSALEAKAEEIALELGVDYLELRNRQTDRTDWPLKDDLYVTFTKQLDPEPEKNMLAIPRKQRAMVRKGIKTGLVAEIDNDIERFFGIYSTSVRNLGTPVFAKRYFSLLKEVFGSECEVLSVCREDRVVSSVMSFYFRDQVLPYYGGGTLEARQYNGYDFMYWEVMRRACEKGYRLFDYGRSKVGTGSYSFKKNWGFTPTPLQYQYRLVKSQDVPNLNPLNPKYQLFISMWKKLPLPLANFIGPKLSRNLG